MDCSGERFVPQRADPYDEISVEHQQRYRSLKDLVRGMTVLDAGCGEGYGARLLRETAAHVVGMDISWESVRSARESYARPDLLFLAASVGALPFARGSFDLVVSFEVIEHVSEELQAAFLTEVRRVLRADGILVISTPNKAVYSDSAQHHNRFHQKEFYIDEFESFLRRSFPRVRLFGQSWFVSSVLSHPSSGHLESHRLAEETTPAPKYVVAICGTSDRVETVDLSSIVVDPRGRFEGMWNRILELQAEVEGRNAWAASLEKDVRTIGEVAAHYKQESADFEARLSRAHEHIAGLDRHIEELGGHIQRQRAEISGLEKNVVELHARIEALEDLLRGREAELESIKQSDFWKVATRYWRLRDSMLPPGSRRRLLLKRAFRSSKAGLQRLRDLSRSKSRRSGGSLPPPAGPDPAETEKPIQFPGASLPRVSIIVPAFNQWACTYRCMKSIRRTMEGTECEVILADDASTDPTVRAGEILLGVRVLRDGENRGFLRNCNRAAGQARAPYLYFLNNDTELQQGAIQALVSVLDRDPTVGMVGSKLLYPDGGLQEAGGIIWADASGWNFGRGQDPSLPAFNYFRETDYVSGASFMVRSDLWREVGGFDERYAPAYCEDSDLAFEVRRRGFKVVYQPQSVVVHFEGASHGTDVSQSTKAHQVRNTEILRSKWAAELARQFPNGADIFHARDRSGGRKSILVIDHYVPQFDKDAGSRTIWTFLQAFLRMGMNVKFLGDNFFPHQPYTGLLQQSGVEVLTGSWFSDHWREWLTENGRCFDYVFMSRPHIAPKYLDLIRTHTAARVLFYVHDLHYLREAKWAALNGDPSERVRADRTREEERQLMSRMDVVLSCSDVETATIRELCPEAEVCYVPPYAVEVELSAEFHGGERAGILFVGGFSHPPNADGVLWFVREVWPAIRLRLPGVVLSIAGSAPPPEVVSLASDDVQVLGFVTDARLKDLYRMSRLAVIPLRYGAGVKGKTVEAMAHGVPVATTECGIEGMPAVREALDPLQVNADLAEAVTGLYHDLPRLKRISERERAYVARHYTIERIQEAFERAVAR